MRAGWQTFFLAQVGASAALTGLIFVALSINLARIIEFPNLVRRAGEAVVLLVQPVLVGLAVLSPYRSPRTVGAIVAVLAVGGFVSVNRFLVLARPVYTGRPRSEFVGRVVSAELATIPPVIGAIVLLSGSTAGYAWLALAAGLAIVIGILDAWVLLVEILR